MLEVKRKKGEQFEGFLRRTKRVWVDAGTLIEARRRKHREKPKSDNVQRKRAVKLSQKYSKIAYLQKIGKLPEDNPRRRRGSRRR